MVTLAEVEEAIERVPPASGFAILDERSRVVAERGPLEGGGFVVVALDAAGGPGYARRPGDGRGDHDRLKADARNRRVPSGPTQAPVDAADRPARADGRPEAPQPARGPVAPGG